MKIVVLIRQVSTVEMNADSIEKAFGSALSSKKDQWIINPHDEIALEEALQIRETHGGTVTALSFGKPVTEAAVRRALAMGADSGVLIMDELAGNYRDFMLVAHIYWLYLETVGVDLILTGSKSVDGQSFLVGPALAELLSIPCISMVVNQEINGKMIRCRKSTESGEIIMETPLPALLTTAGGLNTPRYVTIPGIKRADKKPIDVLNLSEIASNETISDRLMPEIVSFRRQHNKRSLKMAVGKSSEEKVRHLLDMLHEKSGII